MLERPECTGPFLPLFLRAPRTPLGHHNQLAQGPREHCLIYMTIIFGWLQVRCAREACAARGTRLHPLIHFRNGPFLGVPGWNWGVEGEAANHFCEGERENHCPLFLSTRWQAQPDCCMGRHCIEREYTTKSICYNRRAYWGCCVALTGEGVRGALARFWVGVSFSKKVKNGPGNVQTGRYRPPSQFFGRRVEDKKS